MNLFLNKQVGIQHLSCIDYKRAWDLQEQLFNQIVQLKILNRTAPPEEQRKTPNYLLLCEHEHVYTLGKSGKAQHLLINQDILSTIKASFYHINRGGDITYHGPGQLVVYPILDLDNFFTDIHLYMRRLEEAVILTLADFGISAGRIPGLTGVWINYEEPQKARKICALGVKTSRWVSMHGLALNVNTDLTYFSHIVPCGITDKAVTSMAFELGVNPDMPTVEQKLLFHLANLFGMEFTSMNAPERLDKENISTPTY